ncbi:unnamed protein product [Acanthoscelides obtectus]|uniref:Uncharacterized protein n=1 Tax=Acanthoscelides obtectus TaxID=200917 RepID=A0A9P0PD74_ACAOB|nr:unnamed protein product [Acanthoscelides obtectus]CAK1660582.1 hypothetical protein AOBTE_LOCUS22159 [Acanthoscelides obtectus]
MRLSRYYRLTSSEPPVSQLKLPEEGVVVFLRLLGVNSSGHRPRQPAGEDYRTHHHHRRSLSVRFPVAQIPETTGLGLKKQLF